MDKITIFVGIDISKDTIDVYDSESGHFQFKNNPKGFSLFKKRLSADHWCVMEATGCYHQRLAIYLHEHVIRLSVLNSLVVKHFKQMKLNYVKTDKSDAKMIFRYATEQPLSLWTPEAGYVVECKRYQRAIILYFKQGSALKNMLHSLLTGGQAKNKLVRSIRRQVKHLDKEISLLEIEMEQFIKSNEQDLYSRLNTIPGIGQKTALFLIVLTDGFSKFENASQLCSYVGITQPYESQGAV